MSKKIAVIGRARVGKSRICSRFCKEAHLVTSNFTSGGVDCTKVNFRYILKKECSKENEKIRFISKGSYLNGMEMPFTNEGINEFERILKDNKYAKSEGELAGQKKELDIESDTIEIISQASKYALELMGDDDEIIIIDTPGVSGNINGLYNISDAQVYIFVMRPENSEEYAKSISKIIPVIAGSRVLFLYRMDESVDDCEEYNDMEKSAQKSMKEFEGHLKELRSSSIINTSIEVLNPSETVIPMGAFKNGKTNFAEEKFNEKLLSSLKRIFSKSNFAEEEEIIKNALISKDYDIDALVSYIKKITNEYEINNVGISKNCYKSRFLNEKHDRVKFNDGQETLSLVNINRTEILNDLYNKFNVLQVENSNISKVAKIMQESIIKYVYKKLTTAIKFDCGISNGNHPFETQPPITMWAEEAVIADDLIINNATTQSNKYCEIMKKQGITSKSWGYVSIPSNKYIKEYDYCNKKLDIIVKCKLNYLPSDNTKELIYKSYNLALFKLGQYSIYKFIIAEVGLEDNAIDWL